MPQPRAKRLLCLHCFATLTSDEREHYVYECHACVLVDHDAAALAKADPDHPDVQRRPRSPVLT